MSTNPTLSSPSSSSTLTTDAFESLVPSLVKLIQTIYSEDGSIPQNKQSVAIATSEFKQRMATVRESVEKLPGEEMSLNDQDEVITMLKSLRDQKLAQLEAFSKYRANLTIESEPPVKPVDETT